jgi:CRP-like cAMP-binding protein
MSAHASIGTFGRGSGRPTGFFAPQGASRETDLLKTVGTSLSLSRGDRIYAEGDDTDAWYRIVSGTACTYRIMPDGRRQIGAFLHPGDFFGFEAGQSHRFAAEALGEVQAVRYPRSRLERLATQDADFGRHLRDIACQRLDAAHDQLLLLGRKTALEKVASFLLEMMRHATADTALHLDMSRGDIGDYLGLTLETVSRMFSQMRQMGAIALPTTHSVRILDRTTLTGIAGEATVVAGRA